ncbi:ribonuclease Y [Patescibacteria group bacterium]|nr:ribonuclease Y [Patescibacteria group bacterium]
MNSLELFILIVLALGAGIALGYAWRAYYGRQTKTSAEQQALQILKNAEDEHLRRLGKMEEQLKDAETKHQDVLQRAKEKAIKILEDARLEEKSVLEALKTQQSELVQRESVFAQKILDIDTQRTEIERIRVENIEARKQIDEITTKAREELSRVATLSREDALKELLKNVEDEQAEIILSRMKKLQENASEELDRTAKNILATMIQRQASSHVVETTTTYVELPTEEMKGRIIGREGRNIKAIELLTGCELIIDETPGVVTVSGFSPIRRQIAKRAIEKLVVDGRIHPGRIEEFVEEAKKDLATDIRKAGEDALIQLGISPAEIDPKFTQIVGRLKFRTSYGQNALTHSLEVAQLAAILAEELGADVSICKKGGLFHDVGKAVDHDLQGSHPELGYNIMKKYGFPEEICYQSIGHHEDKPKTLEAIIVKAADAISGARPGARKDSLEFYIKRLGDLERTAKSFEGVDKVYAIQAGREIRVFVNPTQVNDLAATRMAHAIAKKIESELKYPGEIRVTLIRETRVVEVAR